MSAYPFPMADAPALLRDPHPAVRRAASAALSKLLTEGDDEVRAIALWGLATTDACEVLPMVVPLLVADSPRLRHFASICLRSLHPLAGLPALPGPQAEASTGAFMGEWLLPRAHFASALRWALLRARKDPWALIEALAELPGERAVIAEVIGQTLGAAPAQRFEARHRERTSARAPVQLLLALTYRCSRSCPYCYATESMADQAADMDLADARASLDFAVAQGAVQVSFTGGEPTHHPHFPQLVEEVSRRGLRLYLNTSGLFGPQILKALKRPHLMNVGFHVSAPRDHRSGELERIRANAAALIGAGIEVFIRHTLTLESTPEESAWIVAFCESAGIRHLNLGLAFPGRDSENRFLPMHRQHAFKPVLLGLLERAGRAGLRVRMSKPVPLCLLSRVEYAKIQRSHEWLSVCSVHARGGVHNLVVNPDRSTYTCVGLPLPGPALEGSYTPQRETARRSIDDALIAVRSACGACAAGALGVCQAACLGHAFAPSDPRGVA
jgi:MoaA/NifB/PqqE/SkfB family radical SAM enzyme